MRVRVRVKEHSFRVLSNIFRVHTMCMAFLVRDAFYASLYNLFSKKNMLFQAVVIPKNITSNSPNNTPEKTWLIELIVQCTNTLTRTQMGCVLKCFPLHIFTNGKFLSSPLFRAGYTHILSNSHSYAIPNAKTRTKKREKCVKITDINKDLDSSKKNLKLLKIRMR